MSDPFRERETLDAISDINVVPLADVSLVLLIILLILSPMMTQAMLKVRAAGKAEVPSSAEAPPPEDRPESRELVLVVSLTPDGAALGGRNFGGPGELMAVMQAELRGRRDRKVFLAPHPDVSHGKVVNMLETLKFCGAEAVSLVQVRMPAPPEGS